MSECPHNWHGIDGRGKLVGSHPGSDTAEPCGRRVVDIWPPTEDEQPTQ